jgi:hypothetical protein
MKMLKLTKVQSDRFNDSDDPTEGNNQRTAPVIVNAEAIRCFYPRIQGRPGTRLTFLDGGGFAVAELFEDVERMIAA